MLPRAELTPAKSRRSGRASKPLSGVARSLERGASSLDAVVAAVRVLEDDPLFNAGRGAVYAANGTLELDASLMDGATLRAGAVAGVRHVRSPIELAWRVLEHSPHVMLAGQGRRSSRSSRAWRRCRTASSQPTTDVASSSGFARRAGRPGIADRDRRRGGARRARSPLRPLRPVG